MLDESSGESGAEGLGMVQHNGRESIKEMHRYVLSDMEPEKQVRKQDMSSSLEEYDEQEGSADGIILRASS